MTQRLAGPRAALAEVLCGGDGECLREAQALADLIDELEEAVARLPAPRLSPGGGEPLASRVENLRDLMDAALEETGGEEALAEYLVRRRLYVDLHRHARPARGAARCPVCGHLPTLIRLSRVDEGLYRGYTALARCTCGMEWPFDEWLCPSCGASGRGEFDVYVPRGGAGVRVEVRRCRRCGYRMAVVEGRVGQAEHALANLIASRVG